MIHEAAGDILLTRAQVIAHGIATHDHFDTGLALALRERWPSMVRDYRHAIHAKALEPGETWAWTGVDADGRARGIVNLLTQGMIGDGKAAKPGKATLEHVSRSLKALARHLRDEKVTSVGKRPAIPSGREGR